jgi:hypothetical protein
VPGLRATCAQAGRAVGAGVLGYMRAAGVAVVISGWCHSAAMACPRRVGAGGAWPHSCASYGLTQVPGS